MRTLILTDDQISLLWDAVSECIDNRDGAEDYADTIEEAANIRTESAALRDILAVLE